MHPYFQYLFNTFALFLLVDLFPASTRGRP